MLDNFPLTRLLSGTKNMSLLRRPKASLAELKKALLASTPLIVYLPDTWQKLDGCVERDGRNTSVCLEVCANGRKDHGFDDSVFGGKVVFRPF